MGRKEERNRMQFIRRLYRITVTEQRQTDRDGKEYNQQTTPNQADHTNLGAEK
jgi:hypothetical protein